MTDSESSRLNIVAIPVRFARMLRLVGGTRFRRSAGDGKVAALGPAWQNGASFDVGYTLRGGELSVKDWKIHEQSITLDNPGRTNGQ